MRNALVVGWKEFKTFFQTPIGYVILFVFTLLGGWWFFNLGQFFAQREASVRGLLEALPWLFLVFAPAITMRSWAEERRAGTIETLLTLPLKDWELVTGKFLAALGLVASWLICLSPIVFVVTYFGDPDHGPIWGGFIAALLLGGAYASIGLAASALTENQIISLVVAVAGAFFFLLVGFQSVVSIFPDALKPFLHNLSLQTHFESVSRGVIDSRDLLYYVSFIAFFLVLNTWAVRRRQGRGLAVALSAAILLAVNYLGGSFFTRIDLTDNGRYTLAADTRRILGNLDDDLRLTAYLSSDLPANMTNVRRDIEDMVREFESYAGNKLRVEVVDPDKSEEAKKAAETAGIKSAPIGGQSTDKLEVKAAFLAIVVDYGAKSEKLPFVPSTETLEYDLIRRIAKMTRKGAVKIAWQVSDPMAGMNIPGMQRPPSSDKHGPSTDLRALDGLFKEEYETTTVDLKSPVPDDVKSVMLCNSEGLTDAQKFHLDQFIMRGGGVVVLADGSQVQSFGGMQGGGSPFMRTGNDKLPDEFFSHYGFTINKDLVLDNSCAAISMPVEIAPGLRLPQPVEYFAFPVALRDNIDQQNPITALFNKFVFPFCSSITLNPKPGVTAKALVKSSTKAKHLENFMMIEPMQLLKDDPEQFKDQFVLAAMLEGNFQSFFQVHPVPQEIIDGKPVGDAVGPDGMDFGSMNPGGSPLDVLGGDLGDDEVKALEKPTDATVPAIPPPATDGHDGSDEHDGHDGSNGGDGAGTKPDGGPRSQYQGIDVPGGGVVRAQEIVPPPAAGNPVVPAASAEAAPAPKKEFEYLKQSTAPGRIVVIGSSEFGVDETVRFAVENAYALQNIANYMASENLSGLRAKRLDDRPFDEPTDGQRTFAKLLGWFALPAVLALLGAFVYVWRRSIRPAAARRRMAASGVVS